MSIHNVDSLDFFNNLPLAVSKKLHEQSEVMSFRLGEIIFAQDDPAQGIYLIVSGRVKIVRISQESHESTLCVRGVGEYFCPAPILDQGNHLGSAIALTRVTLLVFQKSAFLELCDESLELLALIQGGCFSEVRSLVNRLESLMFRGVRKRIAMTLIGETSNQRPEESVQFELMITQQELANQIDASRESVCRHLSRLQDEQLVSIGRGRIIICDRSGLEKVAKE
ncbi:MAG: Crp/Fnr family transcriptional regulator [Chloroflexi bacterium]|nr:Crp/Fnr family transcriptional regulator [Chloroflexota bacterium]